MAGLGRADHAADPHVLPQLPPSLAILLGLQNQLNPLQFRPCVDANRIPGLGSARVAVQEEIDPGLYFVPAGCVFVIGPGYVRSAKTPVRVAFSDVSGTQLRGTTRSCPARDEAAKMPRTETMTVRRMFTRSLTECG